MKGRVKVIYIMGHARSGSTRLASMLGAHREAFPAGRLRRLQHAVSSNLEYCSCGKVVTQCEFWLNVRGAWARMRSFSPWSYPGLQRKFESLHLTAREVRGLGHAVASESFQRYSEHTVALYEAIHSVSGATCVVDSSRCPGRAWRLASMDGIDLRLIHLVRDPRNVLNQPDYAPIYRRACAAGSWLVTNALSNRIRMAFGHRALLVRYEDLQRDPLGTLRSIGGLAGLDLSSVTEQIRSGASFVPQHMIPGSRASGNRDTPIERDRECTAFSDLQSRCLRLVTSPVARHYGYSLGARSLEPD